MTGIAPRFRAHALSGAGYGRPMTQTTDDTTDRHDTLRVVQLNIGSLIEPGWEERRHEIVAWLQRLDADVVCLEEVWEGPSNPNTAGWLADSMPESRWHWAFGGAPFGDGIPLGPDVLFGSAVLSRWPIDSSAHHRLPTVDDDNTTVGAIPWELFHASTAGLDVFACHLAPAPTDGLHRRAQVVEIVRIIEETRGAKDHSFGFGRRSTGMPAILCGDFNAEPDSDEIRFLTGSTVLDGRTAFFQDSWRVAGEGPGYTQDWRSNALADAMNLHRKRIDYVFVGSPFMRAGGAGRVLDARLAFHENITGSDASDHFGLVVDILWPERPVQQNVAR